MSTVTGRPSDALAGNEPSISYTDKPEGPIAAAILAGGVGALTLGVVTTLVEASASIKKALTLSTEVGPLSGKVAITVGVWLVVWVALHLVYRTRPYETRRALAFALVLVGLGVLGTFPTFFQAFA
jgi:hypothetical protein